ncbi:hypothetical protein EGR_09952 [Echinococcus granulosus]|uniref:Uncharacterized protein n=1 Tax=Echinococcus granulosus TaxID=6210 RepID=W6UP44_ECHGR|nr:hypothetical protein EGR_09952 [Echinococcus granulosus]EUB55189.1 hypothetical protein EGR_09952 [Echinococcus granulosus]
MRAAVCLAVSGGLAMWPVVGMAVSFVKKTPVFSVNSPCRPTNDLILRSSLEHMQGFGVDGGGSSHELELRLNHSRPLLLSTFVFLFSASVSTSALASNSTSTSFSASTFT